MAKTSATRWSDTITYLNTKFPLARPLLGEHIESLVPAGATRDGIAQELSLEFKGGQRNTFPAHLSSKDKRHALRALLLCQRVYFSTIWAKRTSNRTEYNPDAFALAGNWKTLSINHWGFKTEQQVLSGIGMFAVVPSATARDVARVAREGPPNGQPPEIAGNLYLSRTDNEAKGAAETCYRGVLAWLLRSGVVSLRWFMLDTAPNGEIACNRLFGTGQEIWAPDQHFEDTSVLPQVEEGFLVHMWIKKMGIAGWNGHWVVSNGDGTVCGVNNGEVRKTDETVLKAYTKNGKLRSQFEGYGGYIMTQRLNSKGFLEDIPKEPLEWADATMVKFDPMTLPNRM